MKKCPFCNAQAPDLACKCPGCGEWIEMAFPDPSATDRTSGEKASGQFIAVYLSLTIFGMIVGLALYFTTALPFRSHLKQQREQIQELLRKK